MGQPMVTIVGLPDGTIKESRDRITAAITNSGYSFPVPRNTGRRSARDLSRTSRLFMRSAVEAREVKVISLGPAWDAGPSGQTRRR